MTDNLITANHAKAGDAKLLAYVLPWQNTVAGLPGGDVLLDHVLPHSLRKNCLGYAGG
jgi:hypothetical protein